VNKIGLSFKSPAAASSSSSGGSSTTASSSSSSTAGRQQVPQAAAAMDGPAAHQGKGQGQVAQGSKAPSASAVRSAALHAAQVRDVGLKLAAKPHLLEFVQQKQVRWESDSFSMCRKFAE
jgi:Tfp pilus assembly protein PilW